MVMGQKKKSQNSEHFSISPWYEGEVPTSRPVMDARQDTLKVRISEEEKQKNIAPVEIQTPVTSPHPLTNWAMPAHLPYMISNK